MRDTIGRVRALLPWHSRGAFSTLFALLWAQPIFLFVTMRRTATAFTILGLFAAITVVATPHVDADGDNLPHFASLRSGEVNMRTGPGRQYPIEWVYQRRGLPMEVVATFEQWRQVRDFEGTVGWIHQSLLSANRKVLVWGEARPIRKEPSGDAAVVLKAGAGVIGTLMACEGAWCRVEIEGVRGWLGREEIWGTYPTETLD